MTFLGNQETILTVGFSGMAEREFAIWDLRNSAAPLAKRKLDDLQGVPWLTFDEENNVLFVAGRGDSSIAMFTYSTQNPNLLEYISSHKSKVPQKGFSMLPKRVVDLSMNEIQRGVRLTATTVEYVSFKVPRKLGGFQEDLYPPVKSGEAAMTFEDYASGQNKEPIKIQLTPDTQIESSQKSI